MVHNENKQGIKGLLAEGDAQDSSPNNANSSAADAENGNDNDDGGRSGGRVPRPRNAAVPITIPVPEGSRPSKVWERLQKGGSLLGDPEERMMAEGQDGNTPGSGMVKVRVVWACCCCCCCCCVLSSGAFGGVRATTLPTTSDPTRPRLSNSSTFSHTCIAD